jgi:N6-adenosine-specific RNA methylase IME4
MLDMKNSAAHDLDKFLEGRRFATVMADPPWRFTNRTGKMAPEHKRLSRYETLTLEEICALPVSEHLESAAHCYLWVPNALLPNGLQVLKAWGFEYKSNLIWHKVRKDGGSDGRGVGFYFRNVTEVVLFGIRGKNARTLAPGRRQVNLFSARKRERKLIGRSEASHVFRGRSAAPYRPYRERVAPRHLCQRRHSGTTSGISRGTVFQGLRMLHVSYAAVLGLPARTAHRVSTRPPNDGTENERGNQHGVVREPLPVPSM